MKSQNSKTTPASTSKMPVCAVLWAVNIARNMDRIFFDIQLQYKFCGKKFSEKNWKSAMILMLKCRTDRVWKNAWFSTGHREGMWSELNWARSSNHLWVYLQQKIVLALSKAWQPATWSDGCCCGVKGQVKGATFRAFAGWQKPKHVFVFVAKKLVTSNNSLNCLPEAKGCKGYSCAQIVRYLAKC